MSKSSRKRRDKRRRERKRRIQAEANQNNIIISDGSVEITAAADDGDGESSGPPTFRMTAYTGGAMYPRGYRTPVVVDLAGLVVADGNRPILLHHDTAQIVGHSTEISVDATTITAEGIVSGTGAAAQEVIGAGRQGFPWRASIGASVESMEEVEAGSEAEANGQTFQGPVLIARQTTLSEISFVPIGADNATTADISANHNRQGADDMEFQAWVEARGFVFADLSEAQEASLRAMYDAESQEPQTQPQQQPNTMPDVAAEMRAAAAAEQNRITGIQRLCASHEGVTIEADGEQVDLAAHAIAQGWTTEQTELHALRASRAAAPAIHARSQDSDCTLEAMQAACMLNAGVDLESHRFRSVQARAMGLPSWMGRDINDDTRQRNMEAAYRYNQLSAVDMCRAALRLAGRDAPLNRNVLIQAAFSSMTLTNIFTTSVNARLLMSYMEVGDSTIGWTSEADVPNFLTNERVRDEAAGGLEKLAPDNEAAHEVPSDVQETYKIARYAKQFVVDEQHIINDSAMQVLRQKPAMMGRAAGRLRPDLVYSILLANGNLSDSVALFDNSHSNVQTSAALSESTLRTIIALIGKQQDNGANLNLPMTHIIVPTDLKHTAANLVDSPVLVYGGDDESRIGSTNTLNTQESIRVVSEARLANGVTDPDSGTAHAGSATSWFAASNEGNTIEVGYLQGSGRAPQVRSETLSGGRWGIGFDVKMDIGAKALDYRALARSTA